MIYRQNARVLEIQPQLKFRGGRSYLRTILSEPKFVSAETTKFSYPWCSATRASREVP